MLKDFLKVWKLERAHLKLGKVQLNFTGAQRGTDEQIRLMKGKKGGNSRVIKRENR